MPHLRNREIEIKLPVDGAAAGRRLLRSAGFRIARSRVFEDNLVFDTPSRTLRGEGALLRLRKVGHKATLTYKGAGTPGKHKDREELELQGVPPNTAQLILARLHFEPAFQYQKYRTEFQRPGTSGVATLDETPIGTFLELEGSARWIDRIARQLGFAERDYILSSYGQLYLDWCRTHNRQPGHMVFRERKPARPR